MKWGVLSAGTVICLALVGGTVGMARLHSQPDTVLTETILANRDHLKVVRAISEMCSNMPAATIPENLVAVSSAGRPSAAKRMSVIRLLRRGRRRSKWQLRIIARNSETNASCSTSRSMVHSLRPCGSRLRLQC